MYNPQAFRTIVDKIDAGRLKSIRDWTRQIARNTPISEVQLTYSGRWVYDLRVTTQSDWIQIIEDLIWNGEKNLVLAFVDRVQSLFGTGKRRPVGTIDDGNLRGEWGRAAYCMAADAPHPSTASTAVPAQLNQSHIGYTNEVGDLQKEVDDVLEGARREVEAERGMRS